MSTKTNALGINLEEEPKTDNQVSHLLVIIGFKYIDNLIMGHWILWIILFEYLFTYAGHHTHINVSCQQCGDVVQPSCIPIVLPYLEVKLKHFTSFLNNKKCFLWKY